MIDIRLSDNLELMAEVKDNTVDLIYCDILYGTGRKFADYQDLKPKRDVIEEHYIPRIKEMHRILKDTGSIYLQMDTKINHWVRCILDDTFGYDNFLNEIVWCYKSGSSSNKKWSDKHDVILFYKKNTYSHNITFEKELAEGTSERYGKEIEKNGGYFWQNQKGKRYKVSGYAKCRDWFVYKTVNYRHSEALSYDTQKPKELVERLIKASSNENDLVADFYGGSFTTAEVCKDLNRNFIGCDISQKAVDIGLNRINS
jgi:site-specific DNA-methyltransferase (adenine-specific)